MVGFFSLSSSSSSSVTSPTRVASGLRMSWVMVPICRSRNFPAAANCSICARNLPR